MNSDYQLILDRLTPRQFQVCQLICTRGLSNKAVGNIMKISESTVKCHVKAILQAHFVTNRNQLILCWHQQHARE